MSPLAFLICLLVAIVIVAVVRNSEKQHEKEASKDLAKVETATLAPIEDPDPSVPPSAISVHNAPWRKYRVCKCDKYLPIFPIEEHEKISDAQLKADGICPNCALPMEKMVQKTGRTFRKSITEWYIDKWTERSYSYDKPNRIRKRINYALREESGIEYKDEA